MSDTGVKRGLYAGGEAQASKLPGYEDNNKKKRVCRNEDPQDCGPTIKKKAIPKDASGLQGCGPTSKKKRKTVPKVTGGPQDCGSTSKKKKAIPKDASGLQDCGPISKKAVPKDTGGLQDCGPTSKKTKAVPKVAGGPQDCRPTGKKKRKTVPEDAGGPQDCGSTSKKGISQETGDPQGSKPTNQKRKGVKYEDAAGGGSKPANQRKRKTKTVRTMAEKDRGFTGDISVQEAAARVTFTDSAESEEESMESRVELTKQKETLTADVVTLKLKQWETKLANFNKMDDELNVQRNNLQLEQDRLLRDRQAFQMQYLLQAGQQQQQLSQASEGFIPMDYGTLQPPSATHRSVSPSEYDSALAPHGSPVLTELRKYKP